MSLLLKDEISRLVLQQGLLNPFERECLQSCSYDLRVGTVFKDGKVISGNHNTELIWDVSIKPSEIVNMLTLEEVKLPKDVYATVFPINSWSSSGLLILNPGHIDPGYEGPVSICAINLSKETKHLQVGKTEMFTILFEKLPCDSEGYKNNPELLNLSRKDYEQRAFLTRGQKMSKSIFELIRENEDEPFLRKMISDAVNDWHKRFWPTVVGILGLVVAIMTYWNDITSSKPSDSPETPPSQISDSLEKELKIAKDSLNLYRLKSTQINNVRSDTTRKG